MSVTGWKPMLDGQDVKNMPIGVVDWGITWTMADDAGYGCRPWLQAAVRPRICSTASRSTQMDMYTNDPAFSILAINPNEGGCP